MSNSREYNFDGLVGPTHNYAGLSPGNLASTHNRNAVSNPRAAALEGLAKMRLLHELGVPQAVLPPHPRPHLPTLRKLGFETIAAAGRADPILLAACSSASAMWAANAATVSPSADTADGRVHFTAANLTGLLHRSIETDHTAAVLRAIFADPKYFAHHDPLPATPSMGDEGAANHMRFANGIEVFVFGRDGSSSVAPKKFPARQARAAGEAIARLHQLDPERTVFLRQHPNAIDAGAFHSDVVAVSHGNVLFHHEFAFADPIEDGLPGVTRLTVSDVDVPLSDAVRSYLFNSQLVTLPDQTLCLIAPAECRSINTVCDYLSTPPPPIDRVEYVDVRQSMRNGGGPACLRLRIELTDAERAAAHPGVFFTSALHAELADCIATHYPESISFTDLTSPVLIDQSRRALQELHRILRLPPAPP